MSGLTDIPGVIINSSPEFCVPGIINISCAGVEGEALLLSLNDILAVSSSSACTTATLEASHVLLAMDIPAELAYSSLRISFGCFTTAAEITKTIEVLREQITRLRKIPPP